MVDSGLGVFLLEAYVADICLLEWTQKQEESASTVTAAVRHEMDTPILKNSNVSCLKIYLSEWDPGWPVQTEDKSGTTVCKLHTLHGSRTTQTHVVLLCTPAEHCLQLRI